jgi:hypothetical protein
MRVHVRLAGADERRIHHPQPFGAVGFSPCAKRLQLCHLALVVCDDQLAAAPVGHAVAFAERVEQARAVHAMDRFQ